MACFGPDATKLLQTWNFADQCTRIEQSHAEALKRRVEFIEYGDLDKLSDEHKTKQNCELLRQAALHRAERLLGSVGALLVSQNVYGAALLTRGHLEATAMLGFFCNRIRSLANGNIPPETFESEVVLGLMGAKHEVFVNAQEPLSILTYVQKADKFLDSDFFKKKTAMLEDCYNWLSEFAHPNFASNSSSFTLDKATGRMMCRHEGEFVKDDFDAVGYLAISAELFVVLFDRFGEQVQAYFGNKN